MMINNFYVASDLVVIQHSINGNEFLREYILTIFNELSRFKDPILIDILLNINDNLELLEYLKDYEDIKELCEVNRYLCQVLNSNLYDFDILT